MYTTVSIENFILLVVCGCAFGKHRKVPYLILIVINVCYMYLENVLLNSLDTDNSNYDHTIFYIVSCAFFLLAFILFICRLTATNLVLAGCMLVQSFMCFIMASNGAVLNGATLPEYDIVYDIQRVVNSLVWVVEIATVLNVEILKTWNAVTTGKKL